MMLILEIAAGVAVGLFVATNFEFAVRLAWDLLKIAVIVGAVVAIGLAIAGCGVPPKQQAGTPAPTKTYPVEPYSIQNPLTFAVFCAGPGGTLYSDAPMGDCSSADYGTEVFAASTLNALSVYDRQIGAGAKEASNRVQVFVDGKPTAIQCTMAMYVTCIDGSDSVSVLPGDVVTIEIAEPSTAAGFSVILGTKGAPAPPVP